MIKKKSISNNMSPIIDAVVKNILENAAVTWVYTANNELELEIGDYQTPTGSNHTGGSLYKVAIQQCRFQIDASKEDRWTFAMQFVCKSREDIVF